LRTADFEKHGARECPLERFYHPALQSKVLDTKHERAASSRAMNPSRPSTAPSSLQQHAADNLRFIRATMESATAFTGVSGKGYVVAGLSAVFAAWLAAQQESPATWLGVWMLEMVLAGTVALAMTAMKTQRQGHVLWSASGRKLLLAFIPAMAIGGVLTLTLFLRGDLSLLPGIWLCIYGAAVTTAGAHSIRLIPVMGIAFMLLGAAVLLLPLPTNLMLGAGLGGLHIVFGILLWRNHGG
jgi:hypothetical protein